MSKPYQETIKLDRNQTQDQDTEPEALIHPSSLVPGTYQLMIAQELDFDGTRQLVKQRRATVKVEAAGWLMIIFFVWARFIQKMTGSRIAFHLLRDASDASEGRSM
ncbi:hypothetical protein CPB83DRAFT_860098 [Crepidotus variabilis]|uniref:Uncharacterized protein n=1 Tax=Crepidotus variabilis TaxID=179855 RepID=A0A9P6E9D7_9AGAR|nr:hypothetical protein CPB83DRAFT_860098 [Crepidotus variabilis]